VAQQLERRVIRSKHRILVGLLGAAAIVVAATAVMATRAAEKEPAKAGGPPPLRVDRSAPLLLDKPGEAKKPAGPAADNLACYCCHVNYKEEPFADVHAKANVGCVKCHGESLAHRNDEDNITPPDVMFPPERIAEACQPCHEGHDVPAVKVIERWQQQCPKTDPERLVCTDCHGRHRLASRQVRWDKKTGKLLPRATDGGAGRKTTNEQAPMTKPQ
jgi:hypothetical protein